METILNTTEDTKPASINEAGLKSFICETINKIGGFMGVNFQIEMEDIKSENEMALVSIKTESDARFLIGKNGNNLQALEHLIKAIVFKNNKLIAKNISIDVNDYKKFRSNMVIDLAKQVVSRVRNNQKAEALMPMTAYERKIIHTELASCPDIITESIGEGPQRRIVIKPYP